MKKKYIEILFITLLLITPARYNFNKNKSGIEYLKIEDIYRIIREYFINNIEIGEDDWSDK